MSICETLSYLGSPSGIQFVLALIGGASLSLIADAIPGFVNLSAKLKRFIFFVICLAIPVGAYLLAIPACDKVFSADGLWAAVQIGGEVFFGTQAMHLRKLQ